MNEPRHLNPLGYLIATIALLGIIVPVVLTLAVHAG